MNEYGDEIVKQRPIGRNDHCHLLAHICIERAHSFALFCRESSTRPKIPFPLDATFIERAIVSIGFAVSGCGRSCADVRLCVFEERFDLIARVKTKPKPNESETITFRINEQTQKRLNMPQV